MQPKRLNTLTSLRFFAASLIVVLHMNGTFWPAIGIQGFTAGVSFFFVLSGFILRLVYGELHSAAEVRRFYFARIARIWPMHLLSIVLLLIMTDAALPNWKIALANVFLLQSWVPHPDWYFSLNGVSWSISTEFAFYALFPLLTWRIGRNWLAKVACATTGIVACALIYPIIRPANSDEALLVLAGLLYISPAARVLEFLVGMLAATLYSRVAHKIKGSMGTWTIAEIAACALVAIGVLYAWPMYQSLSLRHPQLAEWALQSGQFYALATLVFTFAVGRGALSWLLSLRPFVFLGEISFSMYMLHQVIIRAMEAHAHEFIATRPGRAAITFMLLALGAACASFILFEQPARKFLMRLIAPKTVNQDVGRPA
ncbi:acyltransferase family protein [Burkholderia vietnamiensis]|uniref:acyltransferase family protein n=1 Tax=Burkholderia vietnamiensis TaxID=60552 RepID=UPI001CF129B8|nr:acyltransferase [Burkholderia vietnamiensis]MCA8073222.1 acyltransferase [Burkholderia vietnamiensis]